MSAPPTAAPRCPDCSAVGADRKLAHDDTCPLGMALDAMMDEDRGWFAAHPFAVVCHRPLQPAERSEYRMFGFDKTAQMTCTWVIQLQPDLRVRRPCSPDRACADGGAT